MSYRLYLIIFIIALNRTVVAEERVKEPALNDWAFLVYHGQTAQTIFLKLMRFKSPRHIKTYISSIEADKKLFDFWKKRFQFEWANNFTWRWQQELQKDFWELNSYLMLRWNSFPWNKYVYTTIAFGEGFSYSSKVPYIESHDKTNSEETSKFLNFLSYEITIGKPKCRDWSLVYKLHHRSGIFGMINNVSGGSNVTAVGIRYTYQADCSTFK